ncbi:hypothetical protein PIIN_11313 [Serendipita indica DSM 11827]|uniref:Uncharacterized protein n=1 Tax=Serendipita indica (strain DSM 11827) TaxID=1109443 RepID=G4U193_SERID|nr:hypothetical protein PIIN_11313 [Serendipita indica DSM 11827]
MPIRHTRWGTSATRL